MDERLKQIAEHYGLTAQLTKTQEELVELDDEIISLFMSYTDRSKTLPGEIADVYNMLDQLVYLLNINNEVAEQREFKIRRQLGRIEAEKQN